MIFTYQIGNITDSTQSWLEGFKTDKSTHCYWEGNSVQYFHKSVWPFVSRALKGFLPFHLLTSTSKNLSKGNNLIYRQKFIAETHCSLIQSRKTWKPRKYPTITQFIVIFLYAIKMEPIEIILKGF